MCDTAFESLGLRQSNARLIPNPLARRGKSHDAHRYGDGDDADGVCLDQTEQTD